MALSRGFPNRQSRRRRTEWFQGVGDTGVTTFTGSGVSILGSGIITTFGEETLARTRGLLDVQLTSSTSAGDGYFGAVGIGIGTSAAFAVGAGSLPSPITELGWDGWLWHQFISVHEDSADGQGGGAAHQRVEVDSKAMRKLNTDETFFAMAEVVEIGTAVMTIFFDTRFLATLP